MGAQDQAAVYGSIKPPLRAKVRGDVLRTLAISLRMRGAADLEVDEDIPAA
ncbi:hypothetical protein ACP70R_024236 [Stipagrostis hirtigluma subsp. patula]